MRLFASLFISLCAADDPAPPIETPKPVEDRLVVELVAREPEIVTPTGVAVDERGRVWVIENQTHHRPADYKGPPGDRIRIYDDFGPDGRARRVKNFAEGFKNGMGLALTWKGDVYFATRADIHVLRDKDGDDRADEDSVIVRLDTPGDYPHNGLSGFAFDAFDNVYFGMGENLGAPYKLIDSDGTTLTGGGEGGNIYRCRPDGSKLMRVATGFWNPFHMTFDAFGRLFAVDNDPDSRPPCRLLHIIQGGDYGYRFRNGRKGLHPFTAWNGELPGTLPMVAGTGEAPSGIVAYESNGLPSEYIGDLIVTSWGDHVIQRFKLRERGASFTSQAETLVRGGENFYPVGIAIAPDGSLIVSDWADKSYPLHGKGRIWRIRMRESPKDDGLRSAAVAKIDDRGRLIQLLEHPKREIRDAAGRTLIDLKRPKTLIENIELLAGRKDVTPRGRVQALWAVARTEALGIRYWLTQEVPDEAKDAAVGAELMRLTVEFLHPRGAEGIPHEQVGPASKHFEEEWVFPAILPGDVSDAVRLQAMLGLHTQESLVLAAFASTVSDPFVSSAGLEALSRSGTTTTLLKLLETLEKDDAVDQTRLRIGILLALRRIGAAEGRATAPRFLDDPDPGVRRAAIQWVGEERLAEFAPQLAKAAAKPPVTRELFESLLAANEFLAEVVKKPTDEVAGEEYVAKILLDETQPASLRAIALRTLRPDHPAIKTDLLRHFVASDDAGLRLEAVRTLAPRSDGDSVLALREIAADRNADTRLRAEAVVGLGHTAGSGATSLALNTLLENDAPAEVHREAIRSLRGADTRRAVRDAIHRFHLRAEKAGFADAFPRDEFAEQIWLWLKNADAKVVGTEYRDLAARAESQRPKDAAGWQALVTDSPLTPTLSPDGRGSKAERDAQAGERLFFHPRGPQCFACHRVNGRGGNVGPDLSAIGRTLDREKLVRSILEPSKDIAPQYTTWLFALRDGKVVSGIILNDDAQGTLTVGDTDGKTTTIRTADVEERRALDKSIMPDNLIDRVTRQEFRDLLEFLGSLK